MTTAIDVCKICLRTNVNLNEINEVLDKYFEAITNSALKHIDSRLCTQCQYLLKKFYNFYQKCQRSAKVLEKWVFQSLYQTTGVKNVKPLEDLYQQVNQLQLQVCTQDNRKIFKYSHPAEQDNQSIDSVDRLCSISSSLHDPISDEEEEHKHNVDVRDHFTNVDSANLRVPNESTSDAITTYLNKKDIDINQTELHLEYKRLIKVEKPPSTFHEVLIKNNIINNIENENTGIDSTNDNNNKDTGNKIINKNDDITKKNDRDTNDDIDDANLSSDDECLAVKKKRTCIESSDCLFSQCHSANQNDDEKEKDTEDNVKNKKLGHGKRKTEKKDKLNKDTISKLLIIKKSLNKIYKNWEKTSLIDLPQVSITKKERLKKKSSENDEKEKDVVKKLTDMSSDLDSIYKTCNNIINYKEGLINPKERLRSELTEKFAACGELKTEDGYVIDKDTIMKCFDRVSECLMRRLWRFVHDDKPTLEIRAINTLKHIQNKYQNEYQYETVFDIEYLNTMEKVTEEFEKRQTYKCYLDARYKCETCFLGFKYETQLDHHKFSHEESAGDFLCPTCGVRHKSKRSLDTHSKSHEAVYKCKLCPLVTYYRYSMMNHYKQHKGVVYNCEQCNVSFKSKSAYKTHVGLRHREGGHVCTHCGRSLATERALYWHATRAHTTHVGLRHREGGHVCTHCGRSLATERALHWHATRAHTRESKPSPPPEPVCCETCNVQFASQHAYSRHARAAHSDLKPTTQKSKLKLPKKKPVLTCRVCNTTGNSIGWLTLHFRLEHPSVDMTSAYLDKQMHLCHICGKGYTNMYNLRDHLNIHSGKRDHACCVCGARFHRAISLTQHALTHLPPLRACHICGKRFHTHSNLNNHMRGHTNDRRYKCYICEKGFLHRNALNEHIRGVHYRIRRSRKNTLTHTAAATDTDDTSQEIVTNN